MKDFKEVDMYAHLKGFFVSLGYTVRGEVAGLDMAVAKDGNLWAVEMKKNFNMSLLFQALGWETAANGVFVAIPRRVFMKNKGKILHILEKLGMGLVTVAMDSPSFLVEAQLLPNMKEGRNTKTSRALMAEFNGLSFDYNQGGGTQAKIITANREKCLKIAVALNEVGQATAADLIKNYNCPKDTNSVLGRSAYNWFDKVSRGIYTLSDEGKAALAEPRFAQIVNFYKNDNKGVD